MPVYTMSSSRGTRSFPERSPVITTVRFLSPVTVTVTVLTLSPFAKVTVPLAVV
jgi:hypothetical protein